MRASKTACEMTVTPRNPGKAGPGTRRGRKGLLAGIVMAAFCLSPGLPLVPESVVPATAQARSAPDSFADLVEKLLPSVVNVSTSSNIDAHNDLPEFGPDNPFGELFREFFENQRRPDMPPRRSTSLGSGFIIDSSGLIVTNYHVIAEADEITVTLHDDSQLTAELLGRDPKTDIAVLRVKPKKPLDAVSFGSSARTRVGDWIVAIGNPFGLGNSVTAGIVSARQRDINAGPYDDFIQTDASINRGNSGGPMFNLKGEVIGINTAIYSPSGGSVGIGFAVPSDLAKHVVEQIVEYGRTRRGWLGVRIQEVNEEIAESLGLESPKGALVASVSEDGPAAGGNIRPGDVILTFDGKDVPEMRRLPRIVADTPINKKVKVVVWRQGKRVATTITVGELEEAEEQGILDGEGKTSPKKPDAADQKDMKTLGLTLSALTNEAREEFAISSDLNGVLVTSVDSDGPAAAKGLRAGDVIIEVSQEEVSSPGDVVDKIAEDRESGRRSVLMLIDRKGELHFVAMRIDKE